MVIQGEATGIAPWLEFSGVWVNPTGDTLRGSINEPASDLVLETTREAPEAWNIALDHLGGNAFHSAEYADFVESAERVKEWFLIW